MIVELQRSRKSKAKAKAIKYRLINKDSKPVDT
jgi:hypothetical protein